MIAPAWPIRLPGGAVWPAMNPTTGFVTCCLDERRGLLLVGAADLADQHDRLGLRIGLEGREAVDEVGADDRVAADADAGGLADAGAGQLVDDLVGQRAAARDQPDRGPARRSGPA